MFKKFLVTILFVLFFAITPKAFAAEEFATSYDVNFDVGIDGVTQVDEKITLKNLTDQYYASNFNLTIGSTTLTDVTSSDQSGPMDTKVEVEDGKTAVTTQFNQQIVGTNKTQVLNLKFKSKDFAQNIGKTWEVNLPRIPQSKTIENYNLTLSVPISFGDPTSISPNPAKQSQTADRLLFHFTKDQIANSGVSVNFGSIQIFDFNIKYDLQNDSVTPKVTSVVLPPDTEYQDVILDKIEPMPANVTIDDDGNYLAWYQLPPRSKKQINVSGSSKLYIKSKIKNANRLTALQVQEYTKTDKYWDKDNPAISRALLEIFKNGKPETNKEKAKLIYQFVVNTLQYDTNRINGGRLERFGAITALANPSSAVCMEFTDLFIALARASGIPTRELDGYAYSQNKALRPLSLSKDLLHAWPEYFDESKGWVMVDPTWENTSGGVDYFNKFDLNHLVLAIRGISSISPNTSNNTEVEISQREFSGQSRIHVDLDVPDVLWAGLPSSLSVKVSNQGNMVAGSTDLSLSDREISILGQTSIKLGSIPPFGSTVYKVNLRTPFIWQMVEGSVNVSVGDQTFSKKVIIKPLFLFFPIPYIFAGLAVIATIIYLSVLGIHLHKRKIPNKKH